ncbi:MAG: prepilin-type N-terminal cleavage/methylation domain-containing protein [Elusimicrobiaceae bacterium]|nr:prepilin-type N-terminal cleavage/methylation domain-containing protein [Elusimicrobiaceae bacterium]
MIRISAKAFTLIELLVVVLIIGILAAVAVPQYQKAVIKTRGALLMAFLRQGMRAQEMYRLETGKWATSFVDLDIGTDPTVFSTNSFSCRLTNTTDEMDDFRAFDCYLKGFYPLPVIEKYMNQKDINCWTRDNQKAKEICRLLGGIPHPSSPDLISYIPWD